MSIAETHQTQTTAPLPGNKNINKGTIAGVGAELIIILAICLWGVVWRYQDWQSVRLKNHDMIIYHENADRLLQHAILPALGDLSSYMSYSPPGTTYWVALGKLFATDPRWQEFLPEILLFFLELLFAWLLVRAVFGRTMALFAVVGIGISRFGFLGLWPIGNAAYVLGAAYFLLLWARDNRTWALGAAIGWFGFGLLVDLAILPALFLFPLVWLVFHPAWKSIWPVIGLLIVGLIWFPYLQWESQHNFQDLLSIINRSPADTPASDNTQVPYCNASLLGESGTWSGGYADWGFPDQGSRFIIHTGTGVAAQIRYRVCQLAVNLDRNFDANFFSWGTWPAGNSILWMLWMAGAFGLGLGGLRSIVRFDGWMRGWLARHSLALGIAGGILACIWALVFAFQSTLLNFLAARLKGGEWPGTSAQVISFLPALGVSAIAALWVSTYLRDHAARGLGVLVGAVWVAWPCLWILAEPSVELRFWWFWPFEVICLIIACFALGQQWLSHIHIHTYVLPIFACLALVPALFLQSQLINWRDNGYSGVDTGQLAIVDEIGSQYAGGKSASVGYQLLTLDYTALYARSHDLHHRAGAWFDYLLYSRWNLENANRSIAGLADGDQFRILELLPPCRPDMVPPNAPWPGYRSVGVFSCYVLYAIQRPGVSPN